MERRDTGLKTTAVMTAIRARVGARTLSPGDRLPSIRGLAATLGVSSSTVVEAYDRLAAEGLVRARRGSGFYVADHVLPPLRLSADISPTARTVDPFWVSRQSLDAGDQVLKPGCGWLPADWMPNDAMRRALRALARDEQAPLSYYGNAHGSLVLRRLMLTRLADEGLEVTPGQLMLTGSGTQALDLVCRLLLRPGDTVVIDAPCYFNFQALLTAHQVRIVGVPHTLSGPDMAIFEALVEAEKPRLYVTNSGLQNPTGATLSPQIAHRLLNLVSRHDMIVVEDDIFSDFEPEPSARLAALDGLRNVVRIGSFSKTLSASMRCGYIAARPDWIEELVNLQIATNFGGPSPVATDLIAQVLSGGSYRKHMDELRRRLDRSRRDAADRLASLAIRPWLMPRGGFYLWCALPDGAGSTAMAQAALDDGVILAPGNVFSVSGNAGRFMRFNVAHMTEAALYPKLEAALLKARRHG